MSKYTKKSETVETAAVAGELVATNATTLVIEDVAIPSKAGRKSYVFYPIDSLVAGSTQSFLIPTDNSKKTTLSVRTFASKNGLKAIVREEATGIRVWRGVPKPRAAKAAPVVAEATA